MRLASAILRTWLPSPTRSVLSSPVGAGEERRHRMESLTHHLPSLRSAPLTCEGKWKGAASCGWGLEGGKEVQSVRF